MLAIGFYQHFPDCIMGSSLMKTEDFQIGLFQINFPE